MEQTFFGQLDADMISHGDSMHLNITLQDVNNFEYCSIVILKLNPPSQTLFRVQFQKIDKMVISNMYNLYLVNEQRSHTCFN